MFFNFYVPFTVCFFVCSATATQIFRLLCLGFVAFKQFVKSNGSDFTVFAVNSSVQAKKFSVRLQFSLNAPLGLYAVRQVFSLFLTRKLRCADNFAC